MTDPERIATLEKRVTDLEAKPDVSIAINDFIRKHYMGWIRTVVVIGAIYLSRHGTGTDRPATVNPQAVSNAVAIATELVKAGIISP